MLISDNVISGPEGAAPPPLPFTGHAPSRASCPTGRMINLLALKADYSLKWVALNSAKCFNNMLLFSSDSSSPVHLQNNGVEIKNEIPLYDLNKFAINIIPYVMTL